MHRRMLKETNRIKTKRANSQLDWEFLIAELLVSVEWVVKLLGYLDYEGWVVCGLVGMRQISWGDVDLKVS